MRDSERPVMKNLTFGIVEDSYFGYRGFASVPGCRELGMFWSDLCQKFIEIAMMRNGTLATILYRYLYTAIRRTVCHPCQH